MHTDVRMQKGEGCTVHFFPVLKFFFFFFLFFNLQLGVLFLFRGAINKCFLHVLNNNTSNWIDWFFFYLKGHEQDALKLMSTYLPKDGSGGSAYQEGGGLFALGNCS